VTDLFLSYKAEDRARVAPLVQALETDGLSVWWDAHIGGGDDWRDTILRHLEAARGVIVVWSKRSVGGHGQFVRDEATRALKRGTYFPVRIDKVDPPLGFGEMQALDLSSWKGDRSDERYQVLLSALRKRLGIKASPLGPTVDRGGVSRRAVVAGGTVAAVAVAGAGTWFFMKPTAARAESIAVMPFANLSGDPNQAYFSDGIAEELRGALSRIVGLKVVARTSSEAVRDVDAKTAAEKLGVSDILTGSVRRSPSLIRISAQLVDGRLGTERWSETYDRAPGDALLIQSDIADKVAEALSIRLGGSDQSRIAQGGTNNPDAHDLLLKAQSVGRPFDSAERLEQSIGMVDAALALDPNYGQAVAIKARLLAMKAGSFPANAADSQRIYRQAESTARQAVQLSPQSRLGYLALAEILGQQLHLRAALAQFQRMLLVPGNDVKSFPIFLSEIGRFSEAVQIADQAIATDPLNPQAYAWKAIVLGNSRRYAEARKVAERQIELAPGMLWPRGYHAYCQMMLGNNALSRKEFDALGEREMFAAPAYLGALAARQHDAALVDKILEWMRERAADAAYYQFAEIYAQQGRKQEALDALEKAWVARDPGLTMTLVDPLLDPLRGDPRFQAILKRLDFPT
jgi:TolB-like protein